MMCVPGLALFDGIAFIVSDAGNKLTVSHLAPTIPETVYAMFQMTFAIITPALIAGVFADRMKFSAMLVFLSVWSLAVYAPLAHMVWEPTGWDGSAYMQGAGHPDGHRRCRARLDVRGVGEQGRAKRPRHRVGDRRRHGGLRIRRQLSDFDRCTGKVWNRTPPGCCGDVRDWRQRWKWSSRKLRNFVMEVALGRRFCEVLSWRGTAFANWRDPNEQSV